MTSREEKRLAGDLAGWLEGQQADLSQDPTSRAVARTAVLLVDALAPVPLPEDARARLYRRAVTDAEGYHPVIGEEGLQEMLRVARQVPVPAWLGLGGVAAGLVVGMALFRQRESRLPA